MSKNKITYAFDIETGKLVSSFQGLTSTIDNKKSKKTKKKIDKLKEKHNLYQGNLNLLLIKDIINLSLESLSNLILELREHHFPENLDDKMEGKIESVDNLIISVLDIYKYLINHKNLNETHIYDFKKEITSLQSMYPSHYKPLNNTFSNIDYYLTKIIKI